VRRRSNPWANAALKACHGEDGFLDDPGQCQFDPSSLVCKAGETDQCLSAPQIAALKTIYSGLHDASGNTIIPGYPRGGEAGSVAWPLWITGAEPKRVAGTLIYGFQTGYFSNMVFDNPRWDFHSQSPVDDLAEAQKKTGSALDATDPDLSAFRAAGGKLLQYHGWSDAAIPAPSSILYYEQVAAKLGGIDSIRSFYRLLWRRACSIAVWASVPTRSAACSACPRPTTTLRMTSWRLWRTGSKTARRQIRSSQRSTATTTRRRAS
jgi:hypothetical protein